MYLLLTREIYPLHKVHHFCSWAISASSFMYLINNTLHSKVHIYFTFCWIYSILFDRYSLIQLLSRTVQVGLLPGIVEYFIGQQVYLKNKSIWSTGHIQFPPFVCICNFMYPMLQAVFLHRYACFPIQSVLVEVPS